MTHRRKITNNQDIRVVTKNEFIKGCGMDKASLKATKLLYIAIAQCRQSDQEFYEYGLTVPEFAAMMDVEPTNVYQEADAITDELMRAFVKVKRENNRFRKYTVFALCDYDGAEIYFKINKDMTDFLLGITSDFTKPLLDDFLRMNSVYSIKVWHLLQKYMKSQKPAFAIEGMEPEFDVPLAELREVTGTQDKLKQISDFKIKVLDKALREIEECAGVKLIYTNKKRNKTIVGFHFKVVPLYTISPEKAQEIDDYFEEKERMQKAEEQIPGQQSFENDYGGWFSSKK